MLDRTDAAESTGHGVAMPQMLHGGPGRAGGGEELGGLRAVRHYLQRTAVQGHPDLLASLIPGGSRARRVSDDAALDQGRRPALGRGQAAAVRAADDLAAAGLDPPAPGAAIADEWWQVTGDDGKVAGYGWLDSEWGDAQITFWVDPARRGEGIGDFIVDHLEAEAAARGLNYIYNVVPASHPDPGLDDGVADPPWLRPRHR